MRDSTPRSACLSAATAFGSGRAAPEGGPDEFWEQARWSEAARLAAQEQIDEEVRESFPASDPPSRTGITGEGRRGR